VLTDALCTRCGLCCDGTLFGDVELTGRAEAGRLEVLGLDVDEDDADTELLALPCAGLRGTRCRVYAHRPQCCRTFECRLLQDTRRGAVSEAQALTRIAEARAQVRHVGALLTRFEARPQRLPLQERCANALAEPSGSNREATRARAALGEAAAALARTIQTTFLDGE
jgi:Fe-S-cluster containining protein